MKIFKITEENVNRFAEIIVKFRKNCTYNSMCFSVADIAREVNSETIVDKLLETMDLHGFGVNKIKAFIDNKYVVDDLITQKPNPIIYFTSSMLENYMLYYQKDESFFCQTVPINTKCYSF